jgi:hypothetical protein
MINIYFIHLEFKIKQFGCSTQKLKKNKPEKNIRKKLSQRKWTCSITVSRLTKFV